MGTEKRRHTILREFWSKLRWMYDIAAQAESQCKGLWSIFFSAFFVGAVVHGFFVLVLMDFLGMWTGFLFTFVIVTFIWNFWFEIGFQSYKARNYILGQVNTIIQGIVATGKAEEEAGKKEGKDEPMLH